MTGWWPDVPTLSTVRPRGWSTTLETPTAPTPDIGWWAIHSTTATDTGIGQDHAALLTRTLATDTGIGADTALQQLAEQLAADQGIGGDHAALTPLLRTLDHGVGADTAHPGLHTQDTGIGGDHATLRPPVQLAADQGVGGDLPHQIRARLPAHPTAGIGADTATGGFTPQPPTAIIQVTATGTHQFIPIPVWCRYIDVILLGGGGGGAPGNQLGGSGAGGDAGLYASRRWDRGPSRNTWRQLAILIGSGGASNGGNGGPTELWIDDWTGWTGEYLSAAGGAGKNHQVALPADREGKAPGNHSFQGITATGGTGNSTPPGSGGRGGGGTFWPLNPGSGDAGARGQAWIRFSM